MVLLSEEVPADPETERAKLQGYLDRPGDYALTAEIDGVALGSLDITRIPRIQLRHNAYLTMGIHPDAQGIGLGRHMMAAAVSWAREAGVIHLELNVLADNERAIALYRAFGFETVYLRERFLRRPDGRWCADWLMLCRPQESRG